MWEKVKLGDIVKISKGKKHTPTPNGKHRYINIEELHNPQNYILTDDEGIFVNSNDLIIAWDGANAGMVGTNLIGVIGSTLARLSIVNNTLNSNYLFWYLRSINDIIKSQRTGATIPHVNGNALKELEIPLPPLHIQEKIAEILDKADELRRKDQELQDKYDQLAQAIFIDMFGDPVKNEKGWEVKKLEEVTEIGSSRRVFVEELVEKGIPFYRGTEIGELATNNSVTPSLFISKEHYDKLKIESGVPKKGDLLLPSICPDGRIWVVDNEKEFYYKDGRVLHIKINSSKINSVYLRNHLKYLFLRNYNKIASGTTFAELKIFILKNIEIQLPPQALQEEFAKKIEIIHQLKAQTNAEKSEELFQSLLQK